MNESHALRRHQTHGVIYSIMQDHHDKLMDVFSSDKHINVGNGPGSTSGDCVWFRNAGYGRTRISFLERVGLNHYGTGNGNAFESEGFVHYFCKHTKLSRNESIVKANHKL